MLKLVCLALFLASASASAVPSIFAARGIVSPVELCGGDGTPLELRVTDCTTPPCILLPGETYTIEGDFVASVSNAGVSLRIEAIVLGNPVVIVDQAASSAIIGGDAYTLAYAAVISTAFSGRDIVVQVTIYETANSRLEVCIRAPARVL